MAIAANQTDTRGLTANYLLDTLADRLVDAIAERFWLLGEYPDAGRTCPDIARGLRCFLAGRYLIYYRKLRRGVAILHIFHGARARKATRKTFKSTVR